MTYVSLFKCRLCGETFVRSEAGDRKTAERAAMFASMEKPPEPNAPTMLDIHICDNGGIGIADFLGFRERRGDENSVELLSWYVTIGEAVEPCFSCDDCRHYDGDLRKRSQWHDATCPRYIEAKKAREARAQQEEKRAQALRATFKVIKGGRDHV